MLSLIANEGFLNCRPREIHTTLWTSLFCKPISGAKGTVSTLLSLRFDRTWKVWVTTGAQDQRRSGP